MITNAAYIFAMIINVLWFSAAFRYFSFQNETATKMMVAKSARNSPIFPTMSAAIRFLGGMNAAFALLSISLLIIVLSGIDVFTSPIERAILLLVLAAAHFSQFVFNIPILKNGGRQGEKYWDVLKGPMRFIFIVDGTAAAISLLAALVQIIG